MPHTNQIFLLSEQHLAYEDLLKQSNLPNFALTQEPREAQILLADPPLLSSRLDEFTQIKWVQATFAGVDRLIQPSLRRDYTLTNVRGVFGPLIAEYVMGHSLMHYRHFMRYQQQQKEHQWQPHTYRSLCGKTMVILGTGSIGSHLSQVAQAFGMTCIGVNKTGIPSSKGQFQHTFHIQELNQALKQADILVNTLPSTPETQQLLDCQALSHLQQALLFNVGRGDIINEADLLLAIKNRWVEHAFLDVFTQEPLISQHPFWRVSQITITPHIAALSPPSAVFDIFTDNYLRWIDGASLQYQVDFQKGY